MTIKLISDFENKVILHNFAEDLMIVSKPDLALWRRTWTRELASWHSPYRALIDCRRLKLADQAAGSHLACMIEHFQNLYLNAVVGFGYDEALGHSFCPFTIYPSEEEAAAALGLKHVAGIRARSSAVLPFEMTAYLNDGFLELSFRETPDWQSKALLTQIRQMAMQQLLKFHEPWTLLVDTTYLGTGGDQQRQVFQQLADFFAALHLKQMIGFQPAQISPLGTTAPPLAVENLPFLIHSSRHDALETIAQ